MPHCGQIIRGARAASRQHRERAGGKRSGQVPAPRHHGRGRLQSRLHAHAHVVIHAGRFSRLRALAAVVLRLRNGVRPRATHGRRRLQHAQIGVRLTRGCAVRVNHARHVRATHCRVKQRIHKPARGSEAAKSWPAPTPCFALLRGRGGRCGRGHTGRRRSRGSSSAGACGCRRGRCSNEDSDVRRRLVAVCRLRASARAAAVTATVAAAVQTHGRANWRRYSGASR